MLSSKVSDNQNQCIAYVQTAVTSAASRSAVRVLVFFLFFSFPVVLKSVYLFLLSDWYF